MLRRSRRHEPKPGEPPGEVRSEHVEEHRPSQITVFAYGPDGFEEHVDVPVEEALELADRDDGVVWINVDGLGDLEILEALWDRFDAHPLVREDVVHLNQRPKFEEYDGHDFLVLQMAQLTPDRLEAEQVSAVFGPGWLLSFQETRGDVFDAVRDRIRKGRPRIRNGDSDYLAYSLLDAIVDGFFPILEVYGERIEAVERSALDEPKEETIEDIHGLKRDLLQVRRALWPLRDAITSMQRTEGSEVLSEETRTFLRDVYDHVVRIMDLVETYRELASSLADVYYSSLSHRMNEVMKVLTIVATIFIPLTFIAGIYGMNFDPSVSPWNMPELQWRYGYPAALLGMVLLSVGMLWIFRRRDWL